MAMPASNADTVAHAVFIDLLPWITARPVRSQLFHDTKPAGRVRAKSRNSGAQLAASSCDPVVGATAIGGICAANSSRFFRWIQRSLALAAPAGKTPGDRDSLLAE